ncbi:MAG: RluA family pseudouridine synthase [Proteobacteria bacterium]|nr:RluA family pseudouridine synthase [Pseudomonadota bacterium]
MEKRVRQYVVLINEDNMRLDEYLAYKIARFSRSRANGCIRAGAVSIEPYRQVRPALKVHTGDIVSLSQTMSGDVPMYDEVVMLDETADFWVFNKPSGMAVHPTANIYHNTLTRYIETELKCQPYVVHRLDKETSGAMIVAKDPASGKALDALFLSREVHKTYDAVVYNAGGRYYPGAQADIEIPLGFAGLVLPRITMGVGELEAHTHLECMEIHGDLAWLHVQIHSGRQHQIRVHLALEGTPIIGDKLYLFGEEFYKSYLDGNETPMFAPHRHLLHAGRLCFSYKGKAYEYSAPVPDMMHAVFKSEISPAMFPTAYSRLYRN